MDDLGPATSEWVVTTTGSPEARYSATPDDAQRVLLGGEEGIRPKRLGQEIVKVSKGACTQVLLRKGRDGSYQMLLNGCVSAAEADGYHLLPQYNEDEVIREDATGREVPAPVVVSVLVEDGACAPESVTLQVRQRTFVAGAQTNEGTEPVLTETKVQPTRPGEVVSRAVAVAYPMAIGPSATVTFVDRSKAREGAAKDALKRAETAKQAITTALRGKKATSQQIADLFNRLGLLTVGVTAAAVGAGTLYFAPQTTGVVLQAFKQWVADASVSLAATGLAAGAVLRDVITFVSSTSQHKALEAQNERDRVESTTAISVFDLPAVLRRVAGVQPGGAYSNVGQALMVEDMQRAGRSDDVAVMEYLLGPEPFTVAEINELVRDYRDTLIKSTEKLEADLEADVLQDIEKRAKTFETSFTKANNVSKPGGNAVLEGAELEAIKTRGYAETTLTILVVDAHRDAGNTRETYHLRSDQSFAAGFVAAGYSKLRADLVGTMNDLNVSLEDQATEGWFGPSTPPAMTIKYGRVTTNAKKSWRNWFVGLNQDVLSRSQEDVTAQLTALVTKIGKSLKALEERVKRDFPADAEVAVPAVMRYLPHVVRMRSIGQAAFEADRENEQVELAVAGEPLTTTSNGLRDALRASQNTLRTTRQAVSQFVERQGLAGARMRTQLAMDAAAPANVNVGDGVSALADGAAPRAVGIDTRHAYAPRMPVDVTGALACREEHAQLREATITRWLAVEAGSGSAKAIAEALGLPPTHVGELVLGVLADLATDDVLERAPDQRQQVSPTGAQLMASALERAVTRVRVAHRLAVAAFQNGPPKARLDDDDALFACYPEGGTFQRLLRESAVWREWQQAWSREDPKLARHDVHAAAAVAAPTGVAALKQLLDAAGKVRAAEVPLDSFPFLAPQTLFMHTHEALAIFGQTPWSSELLRARALAALAVLVEHSYQAAQRLHVMATALGASAGSRARLLRDCVRARPVLQHVPGVNDLTDVPAAYRGAIDLFRRDIATAASPMQPTLPNTPTRSTLWDGANLRHREVLQARLAAMRFDVDAPSRRRAMEDPDTLLTSFAALRVVGGTAVPAQYLVPFGAAVNKGKFPLMGRFFENLPVYVGLLPSTSRPVPVPLPPDAGRVVPRRAHDAQDNHHPFVVTTNGQTKASLVVRPALVNVFPAQGKDPNAAVPATLEAALASSGPTDVDASNAILFNVERLVQCALLVAASDPECPALIVTPPPPAAVKLVDIPPPPAPPQLLLQTKRRLDVVVASFTTDQVVLERLRKQLDADGTDFASLIRATKYYADEEQWWSDEKAERLKKLEQSSEDGARTAFVTGVDGTDEGKAKGAAYDHFKKALGILRGQLTARQQEHEAAWVPVDAENGKRTSAASETRCWELDLWPALVAVADAVARGIVADAPRLYASVPPPPSPCPDPKPADYFTSAVDAWEGVGLAAVPLCELAAVLGSA